MVSYISIKNEAHSEKDLNSYEYDHEAKINQLRIDVITSKVWHIKLNCGGPSLTFQKWIS